MRSGNGPMTNADRHGTRPRGQALVEFALISPLSFLLFIGCLDFGRVFYSAMAITHAARAGTQYGAQNNNTSGDFDGMTQAALAAAGDLTGVTVTPERYCLCADGSSVDCITGVCNPEGVRRLGDDHRESPGRADSRNKAPFPGRGRSLRPN